MCKKGGNHSELGLFRENSRTEEKTRAPGFILLSVTHGGEHCKDRPY